MKIMRRGLPGAFAPHDLGWSVYELNAASLYEMIIFILHPDGLLQIVLDEFDALQAIVNVFFSF